MHIKIDEVDRAILDCLQEDARMQCSDISRRLGNMTARAIRNRLDRLISEGFIAVSAGAVAYRLGYPISADIYMGVEPGKIQEVPRRLTELDEVFYVALTTGDTDISTSLFARRYGQSSDLHLGFFARNSRCSEDENLHPYKDPEAEL